jgi:hypothetical protein
MWYVMTEFEGVVEQYAMLRDRNDAVALAGDMCDRQGGIGVDAWVQEPSYEQLLTHIDKIHRHIVAGKGTDALVGELEELRERAHDMMQEQRYTDRCPVHEDDALGEDHYQVYGDADAGCGMHAGESDIPF